MVRAERNGNRTRDLPFGVWNGSGFPPSIWRERAMEATALLRRKAKLSKHWGVMNIDMKRAILAVEWALAEERYYAERGRNPINP